MSLPTRVETPRLTLRTWQTDDAETMALAVTESIDHLRPWLPWIAFEPLTVKERHELIAGWERDRGANGDTVYGIFLDGLPIGGTGLHRRVGPNGLEIGYWVHPDHTRRGFATEVVAALTDVALAVDGIDRVEIHHDRANVASGRVPEALGYELIEESERPVEAPSESGITCVWVMTEDRWALRRANPASRPER